MKSGLRDRNNGDGRRDGGDRAVVVSMESGLRDRNNHASIGDWKYVIVTESR